MVDSLVNSQAVHPHPGGRPSKIKQDARFTGLFQVIS
jgi:hypothetical protein